MSAKAFEALSKSSESELSPQTAHSQDKSDKENNEKIVAARKNLIRFGSLAVLAFVVWLFATISWFTANRAVETSGMGVLNNYYKSLILSNLITASAYPTDYNTTALPPDSRLVLVDANNNDKAYYLDTVDNGEINFYSFTSDGTSGGTHYTPAPFQKLMSIRVEECDGGTLVATENNTATNAIVKYNKNAVQAVRRLPRHLQQTISYTPMQYWIRQ